MQICQVLLQLGNANKRLNGAANSHKYLLALTAVFPLVINLNGYGYGINHFYLLIYLFSMLCAMLVVLCAVAVYSFKGILSAKLYLVASFLKAGGIINLILYEFGATPAMFNLETFLQIGIFIELLLLSYALAKRYTIFKFKSYELVIAAHERRKPLFHKMP